MTESLLLAGVIELLRGGVTSSLPGCVGATFFLGGAGDTWDLGSPVPVIDVLAQNLGDGEVPLGRRASNRRITLPVGIFAPDLNTLAAARETLLSTVNQPSWTLQWTRPGGNPITFDCFRAATPSPVYSLEEQDALLWRAVLTFEASPYGRSSSLQTLNFSSPVAGAVPPPSPVTIDTFSTVSSSTQPTWWAKAPQAVVGTASAKWDWDSTDEDSSPYYTRTLPATVSITGYTALSFWLGLGSPENYGQWHKGNVSFSVTLTDNAGHTIPAFGATAYCYASNSGSAPTWNQIAISIPQGVAGFDYAHLHAYSIRAWRFIGSDGSLELDADTWLNGLTASSSTGGVPASSRGTVYQLLGVLGSAHTPLALTAQQAPALLPVVVDFTTPGSVSWTPPAGVTSVDVKKWGAGGRGGSRTTAGAGGGGDGGEFAEIANFACTPGTPINGFVGAGGSSASGAWVQRVASGTLNSTSGKSFQGTVSAATTGGLTLIVSIAFGFGGGSVTAVTDTAGNTYARDYAVNPATTGNRCLEIWRCSSAAALGTSDVITVTLSASQSNGGAFIADAYGPLAATDIQGFAFSGTSTGSVAPNATITGSDVVAVAAGCVFAAGDTPSVSAGFTSTGAAANCNTGGSGGLDFLTAYHNAPAAGSTTATFTWGTNHTNVGVILGYTAGTGAVNGQDTWFGAYDATAAHGGLGVADNTATGASGQTGTAVLPNTLTSPDSDFEGGIGNWTGVNCTAAATAAQAHGGTGSMSLTALGPANLFALSCPTASILTQGMPCSPGDLITLTAWFRTAVTARSVNTGVDFYDATGAFLSTLRGSNVTDSAAAWTQATAAVTAPASAARCRATPEVVSAAASEVHYIDDVFFTNGKVFTGGAGATGSTAGGGGGSSAGTGANGNAGSGATGGAAPTGGGAGGAGGAAGGANPGAGGASPGAGGGGAFTTGVAAAGGTGGNGKIELSYTAPQASFRTLIAHMPSPTAPSALVPLVQAGNGTDPPDGREYNVPAPAAGVNARFSGTYTVILANFSWATPASPSTLTVTIKQYEYPGGPSASASVTRTVTPNTDIHNGLVIIDNVTLPVKAIPPDNSSAYFSVAVTSSVSGDRFMDLLFIDTEGQLVLVNVSDSSSYSTYWLDVPAATEDLGLLTGSTFDRSQAVSVMQYAIASGGPLTAEPGDNALLVYAVEGQPAIGVTYTPRYWVDDPGHP